MISLLHNFSYILTPNQGRVHCITSLESLKHDDMTLFYKNVKKMDMRQATVQRLRPILTSNRNKYMFPCITSLLIKLQRRTVSQMKALNKLIILYFIKKSI